MYTQAAALWVNTELAKSTHYFSMTVVYIFSHKLQCIYVVYDEVYKRNTSISIQTAC